MKAIIPISPVVSHYDWRGFDGVPIAASEPLFWEFETEVSYGTFAGRAPSPQEAADRTPCRAGSLGPSADPSGVPNRWDDEREMRRWVKDVDVPTLFTMGLYENQTRQLVGWFDQVRSKVPKVGLFGQWRHDYPNVNFWQPDWARADWDAIVIAWLDRWLRSKDNGVDRWPAAQVQDTTGQWRLERDFPLTGGPVGQLALSSGGALGATKPTGSDTLDPVKSLTRTAAPGTPDAALVWTTPALAAPLRLTGVPVLDAYVQLERPRGRLVGELVALDAAGNPIKRTRRLGARSLQHLDPLIDNRFVQKAAKPPAVGIPVRVPMRFEVADLVVPKGGRLQLTLAAAGAVEGGEQMGYPGNPDMPAIPDPQSGPITVLHDCDHVSALRFLMPHSKPALIDVREVDQEGALGQSPDVARRGPGMAGAPVCGKKPEQLRSFGKRAKGAQ